MTRAITHWFLSVPDSAWRLTSKVLVIAASLLMLADTFSLFRMVLDGSAVMVPYFDALSITPIAAGLGIGAWLVGTLALIHPASASLLGWLGPIGALASAALDQQAFIDLTLLVAIGLTMHWWSVRLSRRDETAQLVGVPLRVLQTQISIVFAWTAIAKLNTRFLSGGVLSVAFIGPVSPPGFFLERRWLVALSILTVVLEVFLAVGLWIDTLRTPAIVTAIVFHVAIVVFFSPTLVLTAFGLAMCSGYALFAAEPWRMPAVIGGEVTRP